MFQNLFPISANMTKLKVFLEFSTAIANIVSCQKYKRSLALNKISFEN